MPDDLTGGQARYVLSPDFFFRNSPEGFLAEGIRTPASVLLDHPRALSLIEVFRTPVSVREATQQPWLAREDAQALVTLLIESGVLVVHTTQDPHAEFLEFHDALMHARSRAAPFANFGLAPEGAPSQHPGGAAINTHDISLPAPHVDEDSYRDNSFHDVLRHRRTARTWSSNQLALSSLAEFLHACGAQIIATHAVSGQEFDTRPYPYAGPVHAVTLAVAAGNVERLDAGLYRYIAEQHSLRPMKRSGPPLGDFPPSSAYIRGVMSGDESKLGQPPAMLLAGIDVASLASKYRGVAYSLALRTAGSVLAVASLCAESTNLGSTILGLGGEHVLADDHGESETSWMVLGELVLTTR